MIREFRFSVNFIHFNKMEPPKDIAVEIALRLKPRDLLNYCLANKQYNNNICNSRDFWFKKLSLDYPEELLEFYQTKVPIKDPKAKYIERLTFLSKQIEAFIPTFIYEVFGPDFNDYLNDTYKNKLYDTIYEIYQTVSYQLTTYTKIYEEDKDRYDDMVYNIINDIFNISPSNINFNSPEGRPDFITREFILKLLEIDKINRERKKLVLELMKQKN